MEAAAIRERGTNLVEIFSPVVRYLEPLRDQITARKKHLARKDFQKALSDFSELAGPYATSGMRQAKASYIGYVVNVRIRARLISEKLEALNLKKLAKMVFTFGENLLTNIHKEIMLWDVLNTTILELSSAQKNLISTQRKVEQTKGSTSKTDNQKLLKELIARQEIVETKSVLAQAIVNKLNKNFDDVLTLIDKLTLMTRGAESAA